MRTFLLTLGLVLATGTLAGCGGSDAPASVDAPASEDALRTSGSPVLKDADSGKTVTVEKGKDITVALSSNPTTGYKWKVTSTDRSFGYPSPAEGTFAGAGRNGPVGSGGTQTFVWKTGSPFLEAGGAAHQVTLEYRRSFESDDVPAARTFKFKVKIKAGATEEAAPSEPERACPTRHSINCMPPISDSSADECADDYRSWAEANCDVSYLD
jgi:predicted secreted protein